MVFRLMNYFQQMHTKLNSLIILSISISTLALATETQPSPEGHKLTGDEKAAIYKALWEQSQAQQKLQSALSVCYYGVHQEDKTGDIECSTKPEDPKSRPEDSKNKSAVSK